MTTIEIERGTHWLSGAGLRPTRQRLSLADLLVGDGKDRHVTAESLYASVLKSGEKVSLATVYNTLRAFCETGLGRVYCARVWRMARKVTSTPICRATRISFGKTVRN